MLLRLEFDPSSRNIACADSCEKVQNPLLVQLPLRQTHCSVEKVYPINHSGQKDTLKPITSPLPCSHLPAFTVSAKMRPRVVSIGSTREDNEICLTLKLMKNLTYQRQTTQALAGKVLSTDCTHI